MLADGLSDHEPPASPESDQPRAGRDAVNEPRKEVLTDDPELVDEILRRNQDDSVKPKDGQASKA